MTDNQVDQGELPMTARSELKEAKLRTMRVRATGLLGMAGVIYVLSTMFGSMHPAIGYVAAFSEAAIIGALADWFAVVALFRHPLHLKFIPHTAILPRNKKRIAAGLAEFIQDNFLSSKAIVARIAELGPANKLREWLLKPENAEKVASFATRLLSFSLSAFDDERVRKFLHDTVVSKLRETDFASAAGQILDVLTENRRHHAVLDEILRLVDEAMKKDEMREYIAKAVVSESRLIGAVRSWGVKLDETIAQKIVSGIAKAIEEIRNDPNHALRQRFDEFIAQYIDKLKRDEATRAKVRSLRDELIGNPALATYIGGLWQEFRAWLTDDLADRSSRVHETIAGMVSSLGRKMDAAPDIREWIDEQILKALPALVDENRQKIGRFIEERINGWHEEKFVAEMEREIGPDLQFIRINGTIVGGLAGLLIYTVSKALV